MPVKHVLHQSEKYIASFSRILEKTVIRPQFLLTDMLSTVIEGGIIMSRTFAEQKILAQQILLYRDFLRLLYGDI